MIDLHEGDCLEIMPRLEKNSVDMILTDLPYGTLNYRSSSSGWDRTLPLEKLWKQWKRLLKPGGCVVLFGSGLFTAKLMLSNPRWHKYNLIWKKGNRPTGFLNAKRQPMRIHEDIVVFCSKATVYNPQFTIGNVNHKRGNAGNANQSSRQYAMFKSTPTIITNKKYPVSIIDFPKERNFMHATQKPVALCEWLIRTFTNKGDTVLDCCMGSGSTGVAAKRNGRRFIGIELNQAFFEIASDRISGESENLFKDM